MGIKQELVVKEQGTERIPFSGGSGPTPTASLPPFAAWRSGICHCSYNHLSRSLNQTTWEINSCQTRPGCPVLCLFCFDVTGIHTMTSPCVWHEIACTIYTYINVCLYVYFYLFTPTNYYAKEACFRTWVFHTVCLSLCDSDSQQEPKQKEEIRFLQIFAKGKADTWNNCF